MEVIGDKGGVDREDKGSGYMDNDMCDDNISKEGDDADRGNGWII